MKLFTIGCAILLTLPCEAQNITGSIFGTVQDTSGQTAPGATVTIRNEATASTLKETTDDRGDFTANGLLPGTYSLLVMKAGFKQFEQSGIVLTAGERRSVGTLALQLGAISETVTVTALTADVQTVSSERSGLVTNKQLTDLM